MDMTKKDWDKTCDKRHREEIKRMGIREYEWNKLSLKVGFICLVVLIISALIRTYQYLF